MSLFFQQPIASPDYTNVDPDAYQREYILSTGKYKLKLVLRMKRNNIFQNSIQILEYHYVSKQLNVVFLSC